MKVVWVDGGMRGRVTVEKREKGGGLGFGRRDKRKRNEREGVA